jgi:hypothetical protein
LYLLSLSKLFHHKSVCGTYLICVSFPYTTTSTLCLRRVHILHKMRFFPPINLVLLLATLAVTEALNIPPNRLVTDISHLDFSNNIFSLRGVNAKPNLDHGTTPSVQGDGRFTKVRPIASALPVRQKPHTHTHPMHLRLENRLCLTKPSKASSPYRTNQDHDRKKDTTSAITRA